MRLKKDILERRKELRNDKEILKNKRPDSDGQREYFLSQIRHINSLIAELNFCLNDE